MAKFLLHTSTVNSANGSSLLKGKWLQAFFVALVLMCFSDAAFAQVLVNFNSAGTASYTVPPGITTITVECIGGGGAGGSRSGSNGAGGGGGGGAYSQSVLSVTPGQIFSYTVGNSSGTTSFGTGPVLVSAAGGASVAANIATGGAGGLASAGTGTVKRNGGTGATASATIGGGGGGAGGATADGANGGSPAINNFGAGNAPGANGGAGATSNANGGNGTVSGGGGGGSYRTSGSRTGGTGAAGLVRISIDCQPTVQVSAPSVTPIATTSATITWTGGDGTGSFVLIRQGSAIATDPTQFTAYTASSTFMSGSLISTGYVVKASAGNTVNVSGLLPNTTYYYKVYSMNTASNCFLVTGAVTGNFTTASCHPSTQPSSVSMTCPATNAMNLKFTRGNGTHVLVVARSGSAVNADPVYNTNYTANAAFGSGTQIGTGNYVVYNGNDPGTISIPVTGLTAGTTYHFKMYEYNASPNCYNVTSPLTTNQATRSAQGAVTSSTGVQVSTTVSPWTVNKEVIRLQVVVGAGVDPAAIVNAITFTTTGSTNVANMTAAKIYYTGLTATFAATTQFGATVNNPSGTHLVTGNMALVGSGTHNFWVAYDIAETAVLGNVVDATVPTINITDNTGTSDRAVTTPAPSGSRAISTPSAPSGHCIPSPVGLSGCNNSYLQTVQLGGHNYTVPCSGAYNNNTGAAAVTVTPNQTYTLNITYSSLFVPQVSAWIDWNQSGTFETSERITTGPLAENTNYDVAVPAGATPGPTRMRLYLLDDDFFTVVNNPCANLNSSGYLIHILDLTVIVAGAGGPPVTCATLAPVITTPVGYTQNSVATQLSATGNSLLWYTVSSGGTGSSTAPTPTTTALGTTAYYVSQTSGCEGPRTQISVVVTPPVVLAPTVTTPVNYCQNATPAQLTATGSNLLWYAASTGGAGLTTAPTPTTSSVGTTPYYVSQTATCESPRAQLNVVVSNPPSITSNTPADPSCAGGDGTIQLGGLAASTTYSVAYELNNVAQTPLSLTSNGSGVITIPALSAGSYDNIVASIGSCASPAYPSSGTITLTAPICTETWTGAVSNAWDEPGNWSPTAVPNSCAVTVIINSGSPVISAGHISVGDITVGSGATITLNGQNLNVCGTWTGSGDATNAAVVGSGTTFINNPSVAQTIDGYTKFDILQINNAAGVTLASGANVAVNTGLHLQSGVLNATAGTLRLLSTAANHNAYIDNFTFGGTPGSISGNVIVDRFVPVVGYNQHFISSPVSTPALSQINASGPDGSFVTPTPDCDERRSAAGTPYGSVFTYVDGHMPQGGCMLGNWRVTSAGNMANGKGYSTYLNGNAILSLTGTANITDNVDVTGLNNSGYDSVQTKQGQWIESGWNLVGNPFPSAISLTQERISHGFQNQVQVWKTSGPFAGTWQSAVITQNTIVIPPFQAFMVRTTHASTGNHTYPFLLSERVRNNTQAFYRGVTENSLTLEVDYNGVKDMTNIAFNPEATTNFDDEFDANKYNGGAGRPTLYTTMSSPKWYSINTLPSLIETTTVPVGLRPEVNGLMVISAQGIETFDPTTYIVLEDKQTGTWHNLRNGAYSFTANKADAQDRFVLHFTAPAQILTSDASCDMPGQVDITQPGSTNWNYTLTDAANTATIAKGVVNQYTPVSVSVNAGDYLLTLSDNIGYAVVKNILVAGLQQVKAEFTANTNSALTDEDITFSSTSGDMITSNNWDFGDGTHATGQTATHSYLNEGVYNVSLNVANAEGCSSTSSRTVTVTSRSTATGIEELNNKSIQIWSNDNRVFVDFSKQGKVEAEIEIYNVIGQLLNREKFGKSTVYSREINNTGAAYIIVKVKNGDEVTTRKLFVANK